MGVLCIIVVRALIFFKSFSKYFDEPREEILIGVFTRYMLLAVSKRDSEDDRTLGELFYLMISEVANITYHESMQIIVEAMMATVQEEFHIADAQLEAFYAKFMSKLPEPTQRLSQAT